MGVATVQFMSKALGKYVSYNVALPEKGEGPFPVLMQLHGMSDDYQCWVQRSNIARYAEKYQVIIVFPDGGTSRYLNWPGHQRWGQGKYEDLLTQDIPAHLKRNFRVRDGLWAIGGLSMGGFGSLRLGLKYPKLFGSVWGHSSAIHIEPELKALIGNGDDSEILPHAAGAAAAGTSIAFDCGVDDFLIEHNRWFHDQLEQQGITHIYNEHPGAHTWEYWDEHVQTALAHHAGVLGWEPAPTE